MRKLWDWVGSESYLRATKWLLITGGVLMFLGIVGQAFAGVTVSKHVDRLTIGGTIQAEPDACNDDLDDDGEPYLPSGWFWRYGQLSDAKLFRFFIKTGTIPSGYNSQAVIDRLKVGPQAWEQTVNDCGFPSHFPSPGSWYLDVSYGGVAGSSRNSNISATATTITCGPTRDGWNVMKFMNLPNTVGAVTCTWRNSDGVALESDQAYNTDYSWDVVDDGICSSMPDLQAVAVHESGHSVGLGHASPESEHPNLTMSPFIGFCETGPRTLGLGDYAAVGSIYSPD